MTAMGGLGWFTLGALWAWGITTILWLMKGHSKHEDRMSDAWLERQRREKEGR